MNRMIRKPTSALRILAAVAALVVAASLPGLARAQAMEPAYSPSQAAYLKGEIKKAQEHFVSQVAAMSGLPEAKIREWVPTDGRDVPPKVRIVPAIERERGKPLDDPVRQKILAADQQRFEAIEAARKEARKR